MRVNSQQHSHVRPQQRGLSGGFLCFLGIPDFERPSLVLGDVCVKLLEGECLRLSSVAKKASGGEDVYADGRRGAAAGSFLEANRAGTRGSRRLSAPRVCVFVFGCLRPLHARVD